LLRSSLMEYAIGVLQDHRNKLMKELGWKEAAAMENELTDAIAVLKNE